MGQLGFYDVADAYAGLDERGDVLAKIDAVADFEVFRSDLEAVWRPGVRRSAAGRPPWDAVLVFKMLFLAGFYGLSDRRMEYEARNRLDFMRFLGLELGDAAPDAKTLWAYRQALVDAEVWEKLQLAFNAYLHHLGYQARGGQMVDGSFVPVPKQRHTEPEQAALRDRRRPAAWTDHAPRDRQKDGDATWARKAGAWLFGYKNHVSVDRENKLIWRFEVATASTHDVRVFTHVVDHDNTSPEVYADRAYDAKWARDWLRAHGMEPRIPRRKPRGRPQAAGERRANQQCSRVRARVEHVFGSICNEGAGPAIRSIGLARARVQVGFQNLAYNLRRLVFLERSGAAQAA